MPNSETPAGLQTVIQAVKIVATPIFAWPLPPDTTRKIILMRDICWWFSVIHASMIIGYSLYDIYRSVLLDTDHAVKLFAEISAGLMLLSAMLITHNEMARLRVLLDELQSFVKQANKEELDVFQLYLTRTVWVHKIVVGSCIVGPFVYIFEPVLVSDKLRPLFLKYPFEIHSTWALSLTYSSEALYIFQVVSMVLADNLWAMLLWYTGARFDMLCKQLRRTSTHDGVRNCIREHQNLLKYVERLKIPVRLIATILLGIGSVAILTGGLILMSYWQPMEELFCGGFDFLKSFFNVDNRGMSMLTRCGNCFMHMMEMQRPPIFVLIKFICFELASCMRLFVYSWPADNLMSVSQQLAVAAFECDWVGKSPEMIKDLLFFTHRAQDPVVLQLPGITDALTLEFYTGIMKAVFSYLLTLNAMINA